MFIIKLGGSVITQKEKQATFRVDVMNNLAKQISQSVEPVILIHGAGSFGHGFARQYSLNEGFSSEAALQLLTISKIPGLNTNS